MTTDYHDIKHFLDQRQLVLAEHKIEAAIGNLNEYIRYTQRGEGRPDGFAVSITDDVTQAITRLSNTLEKLKLENEAQRQLAVARILEVNPVRRQAHELFLHTIPSEIGRAKAVPLRADEQRQADVARYMNAGLNRDEIEKLLSPPMPETERNEWTAKAQELEAELNKIGEFMMDVPRFDPALLAGTRLESVAL
jgi:hypothetical protein